MGKSRLPPEPKRRKLLLGAPAAALAACGGGGGGGTTTQTVVGIYGDSLQHGDYLDGNEWRLLARPAAAQLRALRPELQVIDYSLGAETVREVLGLPNLYGMPPGRLPFKQPFEGGETVAVLAYGVADEAGNGETPSEFYTNYGRLMDMGGHIRLIVVGMARKPDYLAVTRTLAAERGLRYVAIDDIPLVYLDGTHVDQQTSDAIVARWAKEI